MIQIQNNSICMKAKESNKSLLKTYQLEKDFTKLAVFEEKITNNIKRTQFNQCNVLTEFKKMNQLNPIQIGKKMSEIGEHKKKSSFFNNDTHTKIKTLFSNNRESNKNKEINHLDQLNNNQDHELTSNLILINESQGQTNQKKNQLDQKNGKNDTQQSFSNILNVTTNLVDEHLTPVQIMRNFNLNPDNNFGIVKKLFIYQLKMSLLQAKKLRISLDLQESSDNVKRKATYHDLFVNYSQIVTSTISVYEKYEDQNIKVNNYLIYKTKILGKGGYSTVYLCQNLNDNCEYAVKITDKNARMNKTKKKYDYVKEEVTILKRLHSKFVVEVYEIIENDKEIFIIMEYLKNNSLFNKIKELEGFQIWRYFRNIICGVEHCHEIGKIVHRDINANNLLISSEDLLKLSDFGISCIIEDDNDLLPCNSGPSTYTPPEKVYGNSDHYHGKAADMWLIGVTLYHMVYKKPLFVNFGNIVKEDYMNIQLPDDDNLDSRIKTLLSNLLQFDPEKRPSFADIKKNKWVTHNDEYPLPDIYEEAINYCYKITSKEINGMIIQEKNFNIDQNDSI